MSVLSNSIRAAISSVALVAVLSPPSALASNGLVVKLLDGSVPIDQPDLFANAYSKAWNGNNFCAALRADLVSAYASGANTTITSCSAPPYGITSLAGHGSLSAYVTFAAPITVQGTQQFYQETRQGAHVPVTCGFTDRINLLAEDELSLSVPALPPKDPSVSFAPPTLKGTVSSETWDAPCSNAQDEHPGGISAEIALLIPTAASSVNFPGSALNDALSPYRAMVEKDLVSMIYDVSVTTGDVNIQVVNSFRHEVLSEKIYRPMGQTATSGDAAVSNSQGHSVASRAWGTQSVQPATGAANTTPDWGASANSAALAPFGAGSAINHSVGTSLQQLRPQQTLAAPSSLGGSH
jgi:hypothetical protein